MEETTRDPTAAAAKPDMDIFSGWHTVGAGKAHSQLAPQFLNSRHVKGSFPTHQRMDCHVSTSG